MSSFNDNRRIAINTLMLYFRMFITMIISLYTSRIVLNLLGITDYGLYNVIAGVTVLFSFINNAMATATSRFISFELGHQDNDKLKKIFSTSFNIHSGLAIIIFLFCESIGLYIVNFVLTIPTNRLFACNVIYQFVIIITLLNVTQVPMNSLIISYEKMNVYAYIGVAEAGFKLIVAFLLSIITFDKLITLGFLNLIIYLVIYFFYYFYCKKTFDVFDIGFKKIDKIAFKEMTAFSLWNLLGSSANVLKNQGINILINIFFGPTINAANAIAYQINSAIVNFSNNFTTAINPQIIKSYSANEKERMKNLIFMGSKFSFFLLMIVTIPMLLETDIILKLWLNKVPQYTVSLTRLVLVVALIESFVIPVSVGVQASGKIKYYQICITFIYFLSFPLTYIFYKTGAAPTAALYILVILAIVNIPIRLLFLEKYVNIIFFDFLFKVLLKSILVFFLSLVIPLLIYYFMNKGVFRLLLVFFSSFISSAFFIYFFGFTSHERKKLNVKILLKNLIP